MSNHLENTSKELQTGHEGLTDAANNNNGAETSKARKRRSLFRWLSNALLAAFLATAIFSCGGGGGGGGGGGDTPAPGNGIGGTFGAPSISVSAISDQRLEVTWNKVTDAAYYKIYSGTENFVALSTLDKTTDALQWTKTGLTQWTVNYFWAQACKADDTCSDYSVVQAGFTLPPPTAPPAAPSAATIQLASIDGNVIIDWSEVANAHEYKVKYSTIQNDANPTSVTVDQSYEIFSNLPEGNKYYYFKVEACNTINGVPDNCTSSTEKSILTAPKAPTGVDVTTDTSGGLSVSWIASTGGATTYNVFRSTTNDSATAASVATTAGTTQPDAKAASPGTTYYYWVKACNATGCSAFSANDRYIYKPTAPAWKAETIFSTRVKLEWNTSHGATSYKVYGPVNDTDLITAQAGTNLDYTALTASTAFSFWLKACNNDADGNEQCSGLSSVKSGTTLAALTAAPTAKPTGLDATADSTGITLTWNPVTDSSSYEVYHVAATASSTIPNTNSGTPTKESHTFSLTANTEYNFWVKACNGANCTTSDMFTAKTAPLAPAVSSVAAVSSTQLSVNWNQPDGAARYEVYRGTTAAMPSTVYKNISTPATVSLSETGLKPATRYYYWVKACSAFGCSAAAKQPVYLAGRPHGRYA